MAGTKDLLEHVSDLLIRGGTVQYGGEDVSQLEHALQTAALAESTGAVPTLVVAALLHDLGHLLHEGEDAVAVGFDDHHEAMGASYLAGWLDRAVVEPVRLHVAAKRYLCTTEPGYLERLSSVSRYTLQLQGGPFTAAQAEEFLAMPFAAAALQLRRWDEAGKVPGKPAPPLEHFLPLLAVCLETPG